MSVLAGVCGSERTWSAGSAGSVYHGMCCT